MYGISHLPSKGSSTASRRELLAYHESIVVLGSGITQSTSKIGDRFSDLVAPRNGKMEHLSALNQTLMGKNESEGSSEVQSGKSDIAGLIDSTRTPHEREGHVPI